MNKKTVKILLIHIAALGIAAVWIFVFSGTCLFRTVTGIPCPGCGLTRAWLNFFQGNFTYALRYHPLFLLVPPMLFTVIHLRNVFLKKTPLSVYLVVTCAMFAVFIVCYIVRMVRGTIL